MMLSPQRKSGPVAEQSLEPLLKLRQAALTFPETPSIFKRPRIDDDEVDKVGLLPHLNRQAQPSPDDESGGRRPVTCAEAGELCAGLEPGEEGAAFVRVAAGPQRVAEPPGSSPCLPSAALICSFSCRS